MTFDTDTFEIEQHSVTAAVCKNAALFGAAPERGEVDIHLVETAERVGSLIAQAMNLHMVPLPSRPCEPRTLGRWI